jgi:hypothetical protein
MLIFSYYNSLIKVKQMMPEINGKCAGNADRQRDSLSGIPERYQCIIALTTGDGFYMVVGLWLIICGKE